MIYKAIAKLPFSILYLLSNIVAFVLYYVVRYRRNTSYNNIKRAFPNKSTSEVTEIQKSAYQYLTDAFLETIKAYEITHDEIHDRVELVNFDEVQKSLENNQQVFFMTAHTGPIDWIAHAVYNKYNCVVDSVYKPVHKKSLDRFIYTIRSRHHGTPIPYKELAKDIVRRKHVTRSIAMLADLEPRSRDQALLVDFLNQPTRFFLGSERVVKLAGLPTFFIAIKRVRRGCYQAYAKKLADKPSEMEPQSLTRKYASCVEKVILEYPPAWLWTHKRWKKRST